MLIVKCKEHMRDVVKFAKRTNRTQQLVDNLKRLNSFRGKCFLYSDFAPMSFYFELCNAVDGKRDFNGGLIFHGKHDGGGNGGAPTFSVSVTPL
jgi:hypothetical protein